MMHLRREVHIMAINSYKEDENLNETSKIILRMREPHKSIDHRVCH